MLMSGMLRLQMKVFMTRLKTEYFLKKFLACSTDTSKC